MKDLHRPVKSRAHKKKRKKKKEKKNLKLGKESEKRTRKRMVEYDEEQKATTKENPVKIKHLPHKWFS